MKPLILAGLSLLFAASANYCADPVDRSELRGKVLCGYQGWFRCPGDGSNLGWFHWSRDSQSLTPRTVSFEMWPDLSEFAPGELFAAPGFSYGNGVGASLPSSVPSGNGCAPF